ncbi:MAG: class I SAM-dependent methyltransferase [Solirubrobacteraceae bacterium]|nr:class I SAM-dependent methyltransferase [Solirubrobacteraceae bacterium]
MAHQHDHEQHGTNAEQWEQRYATSDRIWSGNPNALLVEHATPLAPGTALELGCGEGADAIWLARQGWTVLATDVAHAALSKAAAHAADEGVPAGAISWARYDLATDFPAGTFDLVTASYLHSWHQEFAREPILRRAAQAVAPGGHLLVISHAGAPAHAEPGKYFPEFPDAAATVGLLELGGGWVVEVAADVTVPMRGPDGAPSSRPDCIVLARRTG